MSQDPHDSPPAPSAPQPRDAPLPPMDPLPPAASPPPVQAEARSSPLGSVGILLIVFAALLVLHTLDLMPNPFVFTPLLLIYIGVRGVRHTEGPSRVLSIGFLTLGVMAQIGVLSSMDASEFGLLAPIVAVSVTLDSMSNSLGHLFTLSLVIAGVFLIRRHQMADVQRAADGGDSSDTATALSSDVVNLIAIFSGAERRMVTNRFRGGRLTTMFGGADLDLRDCEMDLPEARLHVACLFGGAEVRVPAHWEVLIETVPIFGGVGTHGQKKARAAREAAGPARGRLVLTGVAIFGGVDIRVS